MTTLPEGRNRELIEAMGVAAARGGDLALAAIRKAIRLDPTGDELALATRIYASLRAAVVIVPRHETSDSRGGALTRVGLEYDGRTTISVYTHAELAPADVPCVVMPFADLCKEIAPMGLAAHVDPGTEGGGIAPPNWVRSIAEGSADMPNPVLVASATGFDPAVHLAGAKVATLPAPLRERLRQALIASAPVSSAYAVQTTVDGRPAIVVGMVVDPGLAAHQREALTRDVFAWVASLIQEEEMYFVLFRNEDEILTPFRTAGAAFYRKS